MKPGRTDAVRLARLGDLVDILPGFSTGGALTHEPGGTHQVVLSRHLTPGLPYTYADGDRFTIHPKRDAQRYTLQRGDVLFMSRGARNVAARVADVPPATIVPVSFYILRPRADLSPGYLMWYLNQPVAQRDLSQIRTGAGTPIVQREAFADLRVPLPDVATQGRIAALSEMMAREQILLEQRARAAARAHAATSEYLARSLLDCAHTEDGEADA